MGNTQGLASVLLVVLWVRSYRVAYSFDHIGPHLTGIYSIMGVIEFHRDVFIEIPNENEVNWSTTTSEIEEGMGVPDYATWGFAFRSDPDHLRLMMPISLPVVLAIVLAITPWMRQLRGRFSLRTLLIATTLVAVVLGLIVAVLRWPAG